MCPYTVDSPAIVLDERIPGPRTAYTPIIAGRKAGRTLVARHAREACFRNQGVLGGGACGSGIGVHGFLVGVVCGEDEILLVFFFDAFAAVGAGVGGSSPAYTCGEEQTEDGYEEGDGGVPEYDGCCLGGEVEAETAGYDEKEKGEAREWGMEAGD